MKINSKWISVLLVILFLLFVSLLKWLGNRPKWYEEDISIGYSGIIIDKFSERTTHLIVQVGSSTIDASVTSPKLIEQTAIGDSLIKYPNSNCCKLIKDSNIFVLQYIIIPEDILNKSEYLTRINEQKCD